MTEGAPRVGEFSVMTSGLRELLHATSGHRRELLVYYCSAERNELNRQENKATDARENYGRTSASRQAENPENEGKDLPYGNAAGKVLPLIIFYFQFMNDFGNAVAVHQICVDPR